MPILCEFDTLSVHSEANPERDTQTTLYFPSPVTGHPRLSHGFRKLHIDKGANISVQSTSQYFTNTWADCHITTWDDTILYSGSDQIFIVAPDDQDFLTGAHTRNLLIDPNDPPSVWVNFERRFESPPKVVVFLNYIDLDKNHNWRLKTTATDIDRDGFTLNIESWGDTILYGAQASWIAYPENRRHIFSTSVNTTDLRPSNLPQLLNSKAISWITRFPKVPTVFVALNHIDIDCKANLRINAYVDKVTRTGLVWHIDSWDDSILYSAGASIIAFV